MNEAHATDITTADFEQQVLAASATRPVLVDFWAPWCQPCLMLAPILAEIGAHYGERLRIVKVNTDHEQALAAHFGIRSLPTVMLFVNGAVATQFSGLMPARRIQALLEPHLPRPSDALRRQAAEAHDAGKPDAAVAALQKALQQDPDNYRIHPELAALLIEQGELDEAEQVIKELPANLQQEREPAALLARLAFARTAAGSPDRESLEAAARRNGSLEARYALSAHQVMEGKYEEAMENLLEIIRRDRSFRDDGARRALLDIFTLLDNEGPLVRKYRAQLSAAIN